MILEAMRLVADALDSTSYGVNKKLSEMDADSEFTPDGRPPAVVSVLDPTRDDEVAKDGAPADWPVLLVTSPVASQIEGGASQAVRDSVQVPVSIAYVTREADGAEATRNALYTMRAVLKTLATWIDGNEADRTMHAIQVIEIRDLSFGELDESIADGATVRGAILAPLFVRETNPT